MIVCPDTGKIVYPDKRAAKQAKTRVRFLRRRLLPYRCDRCEGWHLGHRTAGYYQRQTLA